MKSFPLFLIFSLSLLAVIGVNLVDAQPNHNTLCTDSLQHCYAVQTIFGVNKPPDKHETFQGNRYSVQVPDLNISSPDICVEDVTVVTQWVRFSHTVGISSAMPVFNNYWMELGITKGSHDVDTVDLRTNVHNGNNDPICINNPSIYYAISDEMGYREFIISTPIQIGENINFSIEDPNNDGIWQIKSSKSNFAHAQVTQVSYKDHFRENHIGVESTIPGDRYSSIPPTHFKNIQVHKNGIWQNWSENKDHVVSTHHQYDIKKCGNDYNLLAGSATSLDCSRTLIINKAPIATNQIITVTGPTQLRLESTDFDLNWLQFYVEEFPTKGTINHVNKGTPISDSTGTFVLLEYTPMNPGTDTLKFRVSDSRSDDIGMITITYDPEDGTNLREICLPGSTTCFNDLQSLCNANPSDNRCDGTQTGNDKNYPPTVSVTLVSHGQKSGTTIALSSSATDANDDDTLSYAWSQVSTSAPNVEIRDANQAEASFVIPSALDAATVIFVFEVKVSDGTTTTTKQVVFSAEILQRPPTVFPEREVDPQTIETVLFSDQFGNFAQWDDHTNWDDDELERNLQADTNNEAATIDTCSNDCPLNMLGNQAQELRNYDNVLVTFWMLFEDRFSSDDSIDVTLAETIFRNQGSFDTTLKTFTPSDSGIGDWFPVEISLSDYLNKEVSIGFSPTLENKKGIIQIDAFEIIGQTIDNEPPRINNVRNVNVETMSQGGIIVNYIVPTARDNIDGVIPVICDKPNGVSYPLGTTIVRCQASDMSGNTTLVTLRIVVELVDNVPPVISDVVDLIYETVNDETSLIVDFDLPTATDNIDGPVPVVCSPGSGTVFDEGITEITCTASDSAGNTAISTFEINVILEIPTCTVFEQYRQDTNTCVNPPPEIVESLPDLTGYVDRFRSTDYLMNLDDHYADPLGEPLTYRVLDVNVHPNYYIILVAEPPTILDRILLLIEVNRQNTITPETEVTVLISDGTTEISDTFTIEHLLRQPQP